MNEEKRSDPSDLFTFGLRNVPVPIFTGLK